MPKKGLPQLKKELIQERLTNDGMTQQEVADAMQLSRAQINVIEKLALRKLKSRLSKMYKKDDLL
jgi:DNA-directed RNA polymerase specialized sigma subunit